MEASPRAAPWPRKAPTSGTSITTGRSTIRSRVRDRQLHSWGLLHFHDAVLPPTRPLHFRPLNETVPVYEGNVHMVQDVTPADRKQLAPLLESSDPRVTIMGTLEYQLCSDTTRYAP